MGRGWRDGDPTLVRSWAPSETWFQRGPCRDSPHLAVPSLPTD